MPMRMHRRAAVTGILGWTLLAAPRNLAATPRLSWDPKGLNTLEVERTGTNRVTLWNSLGAEAMLDSDPPTHPTARWQVRLPASTPMGLAVVRVETGGTGPATTLAVLVDTLKTSPERPEDAQRDPSHALPLHPPIAVEGVLTDATPRHFHLALAAGESIDLEVVSRRLGYRLDPRLRVLDDSGRELARADDSLATGLDAALHFVAPRVGGYVVALDDPRPHEGGPQPFRLRVGHFTPMPLAWLPCVHAHPTPTPPVPVKTLTGPAADWRLDPGKRPLRILGKARPAGTRDVFHLTTTLGEKLRVDLQDRRLGSVGDFTAWLQDDRGRVLTEVDGSRGDSATFLHAFTTAGEHRLIVESVAGEGGPGFDYQLDLDDGPGDFRLHLPENTLTTSPGGSVEWKFKVVRRGHDGPLKLTVHGLPSGIAVSGLEVVAKASEGTLRWTMPADAPRDTTWELGVTGSADTPDRTLVVTAETRGVLRKQWPVLNEPPPFLDGRAWLRIR